MVSDAGEILDPSAPNHHDRVFLKIVANAGYIRSDFGTGHQPNPRYLPQSRIRLLGRRGVHSHADPSFLRARLECRAFRFDTHLLPPVSHQLRNCRHKTSLDNYSLTAGFCSKWKSYQRRFFLSRKVATRNDSLTKEGPRPAQGGTPRRRPVSGESALSASRCSQA